MTIVDPQSEAVLDLVRESLARTLHEEFGETLDEIEILQVLPKPYSLITFLAAITDLGRRRFVLKQIVKHPLNASIVDEPDQALVEYDILARLYPKFAGIERCSVPRPIVALPEIDAFLMEHVEGHDLVGDLKFVHYLASRTMFRQLQDDFYDCGRWLRHFQQFTGLRLAGASLLDNILVRCNDRLRLIEESRDRRYPSDLRKRATDYIEKQVDRLANASILVTGRHGDFGPSNTLTGVGGVTVLDFFGYREDPLPVDIVGMLLRFESLPRFFIANSASRSRALRDRFLAGLGPLPEVPPPLVLLCEAMHRIVAISGPAFERMGEGLQRPMRWTDVWAQSRSLSVNVKWLLMRRQESSLWPR